MTAVHASPPVPGVGQTYAFSQWLDGREWTLIRGRDFWGPPLAFSRRIQASANARRVKVVMNFSDHGSTLTLKAER